MSKENKTSPFSQIKITQINKKHSSSLQKLKEITERNKKIERENSLSANDEMGF